MSYSSSALRFRRGDKYQKEYLYDTTDALATVDGASYFSDGVSVHGMAIGDVVEVRVWSGSVPSFTRSAKNAATLSQHADCFVSSISGNAATITVKTVTP